MQILKNTLPITIRIALISIISFFLLLPLESVENLIDEREARQRYVNAEISRSWGTSQTINGPILIIPYTAHVKSKEWNDTKKRYDEFETQEIRSAYFLPEEIQVSAQITPQTRYRGIFKVLLYLSDIHIEGKFKKPDFAKWKIDSTNIHWDQSRFVFGVSDFKTVKNLSTLQWQQDQVELIPSTFYFNKEMSSSLPSPFKEANEIRFSFNIKMAGSDRMAFVPVGKKSQITIASQWPHPSFSGAYLPNERTIDESGFKAKWDISFLNRSYPQQWIERVNKEGNVEAEVNESMMGLSAFGVDLQFTIDNYQVSTRAIKYGFLLISLTFAVFFLFEIFAKIKVHPIQYIFVGFALTLFYLLLLAGSEYITFNKAYLAASVATSSLVGVYSYWILRAKSKSLLLSMFLGGLYIYLYLIIKAEDYSLLMGSVGLFAILAVIMFITRKIDWYQLSGGKDNANEEIR